MLYEATALLGAVVFLSYVYAQYVYGFWTRRGVPSDKPKFPLGSVTGIGRTANLGKILQQKYNEGRGLPYYGAIMILRPILLIRDPSLIKELLVKHFSTFHDRGFGFNTEREPLLKHVFFLEGKKWRNMRTKLAPTLTSGRMKTMFPTMLSCSKELIDHLKTPAEVGDAVDVKKVFSLYLSNLITRCAFGLNIDAFKNPDAEFLKTSRFVTAPTFLQFLRNVTLFTLAKYLHNVPIRFVPKRVSDFFINTVTDVIKQREEKNIKVNDYMQLLMELKNKGQLDDADTYSHGKIVETAEDPEMARQFTIDEAAAQVLLFFVAGLDTSATAIQFALFELAYQPEIQTKLREEIDKAYADAGGPTYEAIQSMTYLDMVLAETLRKYPPVAFLLREANEAFKMPNSDLVVDKGQRIMISLWGLHHDEDYFPDPQKFDPERFSAANKDNIKPFTYMPFGEGPRVCMATRFAQMQTKIGLCQFLINYKVELCEKTPPAPLTMDARAILTVHKGPLPLKVTRR